MATTTTTLHFLLISLILFISCSHIISCFAIATAKHEEQVQVPSSVTPKAAAVHYWHLKAHNNKPLPPIFLAKLSPLSPSKLFTTNDETMGAMSNGDKVRREKINEQITISYTHAPHNRHSTAIDDMEKIDDQNAIIYTHAPHDRHPTASDDMEKIDDQNAIFYTNAPWLRHSAASNDLEKIDDQNAIFYTHAPHDRHLTASDDMEKIDDQNAIFYTNAPRLRHSAASNDLEKIDDQNIIFYTNAPRLRHSAARNDLEKIDDQNIIFYTNAHSHHHPTANDDMEEIDDQNAIFYTNNNIKMVTSGELKEKAEEQNRPNPQGIFYFREHQLKEGKTIPWVKFVGRGSSQYFLPRSIARKILFSASAISKIFRIPTDSAMYSAMKTTIGLCRMPPNTGETKQCVTSGEDMIDYAFSTLGANNDIQVWSTHNMSGFGGKSLIGKVKVVYDGELTGQNHVTCHKEKFPYLLYACHNVFKTRVYDLEILDTETKEKINQAAAICHLDTSAWSPDHGSFAGLGSAPGKIEVCHWIPPWDMVWTAGHVAQ